MKKKDVHFSNISDSLISVLQQILIFYFYYNIIVSVKVTVYWNDKKISIVDIRGTNGEFGNPVAYEIKKHTLSHRFVVIEVPPIDVRHNGLIDDAVVIRC